ncbi:hypothetical protein C8R44DRAFT_753515 [Mycena epipterygia]|nr:hypothetical protein C8R44DRAFT_753515 [Mycena epipterygia]
MITADTALLLVTHGSWLHSYTKSPPENATLQKLIAPGIPMPTVQLSSSFSNTLCTTIPPTSPSPRHHFQSITSLGGHWKACPTITWASARPIHRKELEVALISSHSSWVHLLQDMHNTFQQHCSRQGKTKAPKAKLTGKSGEYLGFLSRLNSAASAEEYQGTANIRQAAFQASQNTSLHKHIPLSPAAAHMVLATPNTVVSSCRRLRLKEFKNPKFNLNVWQASGSEHRLNQSHLLTRLERKWWSLIFRVALGKFEPYMAIQNFFEDELVRTTVKQAEQIMKDSTHAEHKNALAYVSDILNDEHLLTMNKEKYLATEPFLEPISKLHGDQRHL